MKINKLIVFILLSICSSIYSEPVNITYANNNTIFYIEWPTNITKSIYKHPTFNDVNIEVYTGNDENNSIAYGLTIYRIPEKYGELSNDYINILLTETMNSQIKTIDTIYNINHEIIENYEENINNNYIKSTKLIRHINIILYGYYKSIYSDRYFVSLWSNGIDTKENRIMQNNFIDGIEIRIK